MTARYTHVALDTKINAVKTLPNFLPKEKTLQTGSFVERFSKLQSEEVVHVAAILDSILTEDQKMLLIQKMQ